MFCFQNIDYFLAISRFKNTLIWSISNFSQFKHYVLLYMTKMVSQFEHTSGLPTYPPPSFFFLIFYQNIYHFPIFCPYDIWFFRFFLLQSITTYRSFEPYLYSQLINTRQKVYRQLIRNQSIYLRPSVYVRILVHDNYPTSTSLLRNNTIYDSFSLDLKSQIDFKQFSGTYLNATSLSRIIRYFRSCPDYIPSSSPFLFETIYAYFQAPMTPSSISQFITDRDTFAWGA